MIYVIVKFEPMGKFARSTVSGTVVISNEFVKSLPLVTPNESPFEVYLRVSICKSEKLAILGHARLPLDVLL